MNSLVSISLLTFNGERFIEGCLTSIFNQSYTNLEILIVDNGSTDRTKEILNKFKIKNRGLKFIFNEKNLGFAAGQNQGIRESGGEFVLCLNQDVILDKDFIAEGIKPFLEDKRVGAIQGRLLKYQISKIKNQNSIDTCGLQILRNRKVVNRGQGEIDENQHRKEEEIFGADGAAPIYRKRTLEEVKLSINGDEYFDEDFFSYLEDADLAWRLRLFGWKTVFQPRAIAYHFRGAKENISLSWGQRIKERKKINFSKKYYGWKNQRLMQIKNEIPGLFFRDLFYIAKREIESFGYILFFEPRLLKSVSKFLTQIKKAFQKRRQIMKRKKVSSEEMQGWFI